MGIGTYFLFTCMCMYVVTKKAMCCISYYSISISIIVQIVWAFLHKKARVQ